MTTARSSYALGLALAAATTMFLIAGIGALGIVGDGGRADRIFLAVPLVLVLGALLARLRARGMARALVATALTQVCAAVVAVVAVLTEVDSFAGGSVPDILMVSAMYAALFGASAWLFRRSVAVTAA